MGQKYPIGATFESRFVNEDQAISPREIGLLADIPYICSERRATSSNTNK